MARLNLTIPDALYERLEQVRDRVNVSKVCASALSKELDMVEGMSMGMGQGVNPQDAKIQQLVQRFLRQRETKDRWYGRGKTDGEQWAMERATADELEMLVNEWDEGSITDCDDLGDIDEDEYPTMNVQERLNQWVRTDLSASLGGAEPGKDLLRHALEEADWRMYLQGWWHGARDLWKAARPALS